MSTFIVQHHSDVLEVSADWLLRNSTADALAITVDELHELLEDCNPAERMGIMRVARETKKALRDSDRKQ